MLYSKNVFRYFSLVFRYKDFSFAFVFAGTGLPKGSINFISGTPQGFIRITPRVLLNAGCPPVIHLFRPYRFVRFWKAKIRNKNEYGIKISLRRRGKAPEGC